MTEEEFAALEGQIGDQRIDRIERVGLVHTSDGRWAIAVVEKQPEGNFRNVTYMLEAASIDVMFRVLRATKGEGAELERRMNIAAELLVAEPQGSA